MHDKIEEYVIMHACTSAGVHVVQMLDKLTDEQPVHAPAVCMTYPNIFGKRLT